MLRSVSLAVALHAPCSVEIVRRQHRNESGLSSVSHQDMAWRIWLVKRAGVALEL
ncbi:MAG TPA: hypothetical protein VIH18_10295 [Candidatus Binatia bacterium]